MSEVTRDLKLKDDPSTIVRPNIVASNIPARAIDTAKLKLKTTRLIDYLTDDLNYDISNYLKFSNVLNKLLRGEDGYGFVFRFYYDSLTEDEYSYTMRVDSSHGSGTYMYYAQNGTITIEDDGDYDDFLHQVLGDGTTRAQHIYVLALE